MLVPVDGGGVLVPVDGGGVLVPVDVPGVDVVPLGDPPGGWLGSGVGVSERVLVGDSPSQMDGVGAGEEEYGVTASAAAGTSREPPATTCALSSDTGIAQPSEVLEDLPASGA